jgi:hypothetical protein
MERPIAALPEESAEEIRQETVRILIGSRQPKDSLPGAELRALRSLTANDLLTVLPANKGYAAVVLGISDYNEIASLMQDKASRSLKRISQNPQRARLFSS